MTHSVPQHFHANSLATAARSSHQPELFEITDVKGMAISLPYWSRSSLQRSPTALLPMFTSASSSSGRGLARRVSLFLFLSTGRELLAVFAWIRGFDTEYNVPRGRADSGNSTILLIREVFSVPAAFVIFVFVVQFSLLTVQSLGRNAHQRRRSSPTLSGPRLAVAYFSGLSSHPGFCVPSEFAASRQWDSSCSRWRRSSRIGSSSEAGSSWAGFAAVHGLCFFRLKVTAQTAGSSKCPLTACAVPEDTFSLRCVYAPPRTCKMVPSRLCR